MENKVNRSVRSRYEGFKDRVEELRKKSLEDIDKLLASLTFMEERMHRRLAETRTRLCENEKGEMELPLSTDETTSLLNMPGVLPTKLYGTIELREAINKARQLLSAIMPELRAALEYVRTPFVRDEIEAFIRRADNMHVVFRQLESRMEGEDIADLPSSERGKAEPAKKPLN